MLTGGCFCGRVRYQTDGAPFHETICHCSTCRRASGAPFTAWFSVKCSGFRFVVGEPARFVSSDHGMRSFCAHCGTQLLFEDGNFPDEIDITACSLDEPKAVPPQDHTYIRSKLPWVRLSDGLPKFQQARADR